MADDDLSAKEGFDQTTQAVFRGIAEIAKVHPAIAHSEEAKAFIAVFLPVVGLSVSRTAQRFFADRLPRLSAGYAKAFNNDTEKITALAKSRDDDPDCHEVMFRAFRSMADAVDPSVIEALGYLAGQYNFANKKPDAHFRNLGRLLCDLERDELAELRTMLRGILQCEEDLKEVGEADVIIDWHYGDKPSTVEVDFGHSEFGDIGHLESAPKLFLLLKREGFAGVREPRESDTNGPVSDDTICISFDEVKRILSTIDPNLGKPE